MNTFVASLKSVGELEMLHTEIQDHIVTDRFAYQGEKLQCLVDRCVEGFNHLNGTVEGFYADLVIDIDRLDVGYPDWAPFNQVRRHVGLRADLSFETAVKCGFIPKDISDEREKHTLNLIWKYFIKSARKAPVAAF